MYFWSEYYKNEKQTQQQILHFFQIYYGKVSTLNILNFLNFEISFLKNLIGKLATDQVLKFFKMPVEKDNTFRFCKILQFSQFKFLEVKSTCFPNIYF